jgi:hypothetical protein
VNLQIALRAADEVVVGGDCDLDRAQPGAQSAAALLRAGLRRRHVEATLVRELGFTDQEARDVVAEVLAKKAS